MKKIYPQSIRQIIDRVVAQTDSADAFLQQRACYLWVEVVGPGINRYTTRRYVDNDGVLHIFISSAPLKSELSFHRASLTEKINSILGKNVLKDIVIH